MEGRYLTAQEIAEAAAAHGVAGVPRTKQGVNALAKREGWANLPATLARPRKGRAGGGGMEYHVSLLPEALRAALGHATEVQAASRAVTVAKEEAGRQVAVLEPAQLGARQRQVTSPSSRPDQVAKVSVQKLVSLCPEAEGAPQP